jgi:hypothetical protein
MDLGDLATVAQGEVRFVPLTFDGFNLQSGETLSGTPSPKMTVWPYSPVPDENAANLVIGMAQISGTTVYVLCGNNGTAGFQPGAVYSLFVTVTTSRGQTLTAYGQIACDPLAPPSESSGGTLQDFVESLPNVQHGDPMPAAGNPYVNASGYIVVAQ